MTTANPGCRVHFVVFTTALVVLAVTSTGCSTFSSSTRLDMGPFGENTVHMVGEMQKFQRPAEDLQLRTMDGVTLVYRHRLGAPRAIEELRRIYPATAEQLPPARSLPRGSSRPSSWCWSPSSTGSSGSRSS